MRPRQLGLALAVLAGAQASAQTPPPAAPPAQTYPLPSEVQLDAAVSARNWTVLAAVLLHPATQDDLAKSMQWMRATLDFGGPSLLGVIYSLDLWSLGDRFKVEDPKKDLRVAAVVYTLLTYQLIALSGARCEDQTAPPLRLDQLLEARKPALDFIKTQPKDERTKIVAAAMALEQRTAGLRKDDDLVCRGGDDEKKVRSQSPGLGPDGKPIEGRPPPGWTPKFVDFAVSHERETKIRAGLPATLRRLVGL